MITFRRSEDRGHVDHGWLNSYHTFSFAGYRDANHMGFRSLRVINEDRVEPGQGFGTHAHENMEIVSYVLDGELEHKDSMGNGEVLRPGEFQRITAGTGITHSEFNPSNENGTHFYQIWLYPEKKGIDPGYEQKSFDESLRTNRFQLVASQEGAEGALKIHQDVKIYLANLTANSELSYEPEAERHIWLQVLRGGLRVNGEAMKSGDAAAFSEEALVLLQTDGSAEVMLFDLA